MKRSIGTALAFLAVAGTTNALAAGQARRADAPDRFERADVDKSGDVSFAEFSAILGGQLENADTDKDGKVTVAEIAEVIARSRAQRIAEGMVKRFDANGDGSVTTAEIADREKARFARLDANGDGKLSRDEMPRRGRRTAQ